VGHVAAAGQLSEHGRVDELLDDHLPDGSEPHRDLLAAHTLVDAVENLGVDRPAAEGAPHLNRYFVDNRDDGIQAGVRIT
jgi:hypothetical protein